MTLEHRKFRRVHGLQFPLHPQQVIGWIVILIIVVNTFVILTPLLKPNLRSVFSIVIATIFFTHICSHLAVILLDPADPRVRSQPTNKIIPEFDRNKHSHVIENGRCHLCNITIESKRTKHCSICNKCIIRFDHHCKWLNNCIGARNYCAFLICLISAILASLFVTGLSVTELSLLLFFDRIIDQPATNVTTKNATDSVVLFIVPISDTTIIIAISAIGILSAIVAILLLHLCFFHGYIACLGLTTYEYIRNKKEKKSATAIAATDTIAAATTTTSVTTKITSTEIITTTVTGNNSSTSVQQIVPESKIQHGFCEFVSARCFLLSSFANGENQCFCCYINDNPIKLERKSNQIVIHSPFFYGESKEKNFQFCFSIYDIFESQSKQTSTENSTDVSSENIESTITFRKWNTILPTSIFCCSTSLNSIAMHCTKNVKANISKKQSCDKQSCDDISDQIAYVSTNSYKKVERIGKFLCTYLNKGEKRKRCRKKGKNQEQSYDANIVHIQKSKKINKIDLITKEDYDSFMKNIILLTSITASSFIISFHTLVIVVPLYLKFTPLHKSSITKLDLPESQNQISLRLQKMTGSSTYRFGICFIFQKGQTTKSHISIKLSPILESEFPKPATSQSHSSLSSYSKYSSYLLISSLSTSQSFSSPRVVGDKFYLHEK